MSSTAAIRYTPGKIGNDHTGVLRRSNNMVRVSTDRRPPACLAKDSDLVDGEHEASRASMPVVEPSSCRMESSDMVSFGNWLFHWISS